MKAKSKENDQDNPQDKESYPSYKPDAMAPDEPQAKAGADAKNPK